MNALEKLKNNQIQDIFLFKYFIFGEKTLPSPDYEELPKHGIIVKVVKEAGHSMAWENPDGLAEMIASCL